MRTLGTVLLGILYWVLAIPAIAVLTAMGDCNADGCGQTYGLVPLAALAVGIGGFVLLLIFRREARY
ncbi:hypothetical protein ACFSC3_02120 [Sphingomonas floccifaciens]|uniref:Uncharacterized protein n=1 Tax=Sphingomonas floccifaciens TaxID=1844115 RepID=A0ABW4N9S8_9SPHN